MDKSIWDISTNENFKALDKDINTDILIVGGGITGVSIAYYLKDSHYDITLIEQNKIGQGVTRKTTGKLTYLQSDILTNIVKAHSKYEALKYYQSQKEAINNIISIIKKNNIKCDLQNSPSIIFSRYKKKFNDVKKTLDDLNIKYQLNYPNFKYKNNLYVDDTYVFHPLKYVYSIVDIIKNKIHIYENTRMINLKKKDDLWHIKTNNNTIKCKYLILCNNYPYFLFPYLFPIKTYLEKSDIYIYEKENQNFNAISLDKNVISIRFHNNKMIYLVNSRKLSNNKKGKVPKNYLYSFENYDVITNDYLPFIGLLKPNLFIATGFNTWGMTNSNVASNIINDILLNKKNEYIALFNPYRNLSLKKIKNIFNNTIYNSYAFVKSKLNKHHIIKIDGVKYGEYIDKLGKQHLVKITCPHMKCNLVFNNKDTTWECPCHGSKFDINGNIIKGPSTKNIKGKD